MRERLEKEGVPKESGSHVGWLELYSEGDRKLWERFLQ